MEIYERIKQRRKQLGLSAEEVAAKMGVSPATVYRYENANIANMGIDKVVPIAKALNVSPAYLMGWEETNISDIKKPVSTGGVWISVLGRVAAGVSIEAVEDIIDYEEITPEMARQGEHFALQIDGDSMEPRMTKGDVVIVRKQPDVDSGKVAVVLINGQDATVKKVIKQETGICLVSTNPNYEPRFFTVEDVEKLPITILGRVVELRAKF